MFVYFITLLSPILSQTCTNIYYDSTFLNHHQQSFGLNRLIIIGDIHSDYSALQKIAYYTNVSKSDTFVSLGNTIGYGNDTQEVLQFFMRVPNTVHILGSEEIFTLMKVPQDLGKGDINSFGGHLERVEAFKNGSVYWDYLTRRPLAVQFGDLIATHAGVSQKVAEKVKKIEDINRGYIGNWDLIGPFGPVLYTNYAEWPENATCTSLDSVLGRNKAKFMVMGHSWVQNITTRCKGKAVLTHTGISQAFNSSLSALEVIQSEGKTLAIRALYPKSSELLYFSKVY